jgi:O-antigen ligase
MSGIVLAAIAGCVLVAAAIGAVAASDPVAAPIAAVIVLIAAAIATRPELGTLLVIGLIYGNVAVIAVQFHGVPDLVGVALPLILVAPLVQVLVVERQPVILPRIVPFIVGFFVVSLVSALFALDTSAAFREVRTMIVEGIALYFFIVNLVRTPETLRRVIWTLVLVGAAIGAVILIQELTRNYSNSFLGFAQTTFEPGDTDRPIQQGPIGEQNRFAQVMLYALPLAVYRALDEPSRALRRLGVVCAFLIAAAVVLSFSRGGAVGLVAVLIGLALMRAVRARQVLAIVLAVVVTLAVLPDYRERVSSLLSIGEIFQSDSSHDRADSSARGRATENLVAYLIWIDHPILGVGPDQFGAYHQAYADRVAEYSNLFDVRQRFQQREAHILYLGVAAETGILGLGFLMGILLGTLYELQRARRRHAGSPQLANLASGLFLAVISYMVTSIFLHMSYVRYFWLLIGVSSAASVVLLRTDLAPAVRPYQRPSRVSRLIPRAVLRSHFR